MDKKPVEMICPACSAEALLVRTLKYDGFTKVGETLKCAACGHEFAAEQDVPFKTVRKIQVFDESDAARKIVLFRDDEKQRACRYCTHYLVNPFTQRCAIHKKDVEATDICAQFAPRPPEAPPKDAKKA